MPIIGQISVGDGATFTPSVSSAGELSWTNNKNLENPETVDIAQAVVDAGSLDSRYLQLSGGTMTGDILYNGLTNDVFHVGRTEGDGSYDMGWFNGNNGDGANIALRSAEFTGSGDAGEFILIAKSGSASKSLKGKPDGTLTWGEKNVLTDNVTTINSLSNVITLNSGYSVRGGSLHLISGFLVMLKLGLDLSISVSANSVVTIGSIADAYRPPNDGYGGGSDAVFYINSSGAIQYRPFVAKGNGTWSWMTALYTLI